MKAIWRILKFSKHLWPYYVGVSIGSVLMALLSQVQPLLVKQAIDALPGVIDRSRDMSVIIWAIGLMIASDIGSTLVSNISGYYGDIMAVKLRYFLSTSYFDHLLKLSQRYYATELTGKIINRLNRSIEGITTFANMFSNNFFQVLLTTFFSLIIIAQFSWVVAILFASLYPIFLWLTGRTSVKWQVYQKQINEASDIASGRFAEVVGQVKVTKSYTSEQVESRFFSQMLRKTVKLTNPQSKLWHKEDIYRRLVLNIIFAAVYGYVFWQAAIGNFTIGEVVMFIQYGVLIRLPIFSMSFLVDRSQRAIADSKDYFEAMDEQPDVVDAPDANELNIKDGLVQFDDVNFAYEDGQKVLKGVSFEVKPGSKLALVGESGEGKSTVTNLLMRLYDPQKGQILIDGHDISKVTSLSLRQNIAAVFQEATLFSGTVKENIVYGRPNATMKEIEKAAKAANAYDFIKKLPKGFDTLVGERGLKLSGGQKQRVAIARAILKDAPILILDEATSSLDSKAEHEVQTALEELMKGRTTLIIAHRLSTIAGVDTIVTLKDGQVDEIGSPAKLAKTGGIYSQLLKLQDHSDEKTKKQLKAYDLAA